MILITQTAEILTGYSFYRQPISCRKNESATSKFEYRNDNRFENITENPRSGKHTLNQPVLVNTRARLHRRNEESDRESKFNAKNNDENIKYQENSSFQNNTKPQINNTHRMETAELQE